MFCIECGENLEESAKFCSKCGVKQPEKEMQEPEVADNTAEINGFVPQSKKKQISVSEEPSILEKLVIEEKLLIPFGENKTIEDKEIVLNDNIDCEGSLSLKNCVIIYNGDNIEGQIVIYPGAKLDLSHCSIIGKNNKKRNNNSEKYLIDRGYFSFFDKQYQQANGKTSILEASNCLFLNCLNFAKYIAGKISNSIIRYTTLPEYAETDKDLPVIDSSQPGFELENCIIESDEKAIESYKRNRGWLGRFFSIINCTLINISYPIDLNDYVNNKTGERKNGIMKKCKFINCNHIIEGGGDYGIFDCVFEKCYDIMELSFNTIVNNCQFLECGKRIIIVGDHGVAIQNCQFINIQNPKDNEFNPRITKITGTGEINSYITGWGISIFSSKSHDKVFSIKNCTFDGINHAGFIRFKFDTGLSHFKKFVPYTISDCKFRHCVSGIIDKRNYRRSELYIEQMEISISNCSGLNDNSGGMAENPVARQETSNGELIGARLDEATVGVPGYTKIQK
jgi:hypothetical protein